MEDPVHSRPGSAPTQRESEKENKDNEDNYFMSICSSLSFGSACDDISKRSNDLSFSAPFVASSSQISFSELNGFTSGHDIRLISDLAPTNDDNLTESDCSQDCNMLVAGHKQTGSASCNVLDIYSQPEGNPTLAHNFKKAFGRLCRTGTEQSARSFLPAPLSGLPLGSGTCLDYFRAWEPRLVLPTHNGKSKAVEPEKGYPCRLCEREEGRKVQCETCEDFFHPICLNIAFIGLDYKKLQDATQASRYSNSLAIAKNAWLQCMGSEEGTVRYLELLKAREEDPSDAKKSSHESVRFFCPLCHRLRKSKSIVTACIVCGSDNYEHAIIRCSTARCHSVIHKMCLPHALQSGMFDSGEPKISPLECLWTESNTRDDLSGLLEQSSAWFSLMRRSWKCSGCLQVRSPLLDDMRLRCFPGLCFFFPLDFIGRIFSALVSSFQLHSLGPDTGTPTRRVSPTGRPAYDFSCVTGQLIHFVADLLSFRMCDIQNSGLIACNPDFAAHFLGAKGRLIRKLLNYDLKFRTPVSPVASRRIDEALDLGLGESTPSSIKGKKNPKPLYNIEQGVHSTPTNKKRKLLSGDAGCANRLNQTDSPLQNRLSSAESSASFVHDQSLDINELTSSSIFSADDQPVAEPQIKLLPEGKNFLLSALGQCAVTTRLVGGTHSEMPNLTVPELEIFISDKQSDLDEQILQTSEIPPTRFDLNSVDGFDSFEIPSSGPLKEACCTLDLQFTWVCFVAFVCPAIANAYDQIFTTCRSVRLRKAAAPWKGAFFSNKQPVTLPMIEELYGSSQKLMLPGSQSNSPVEIADNNIWSPEIRKLQLSTEFRDSLLPQKLGRPSPGNSFRSKHHSMAQIKFSSASMGASKGFEKSGDSMKLMPFYDSLLDIYERLEFLYGRGIFLQLFNSKETRQLCIMGESLKNQTAGIPLPRSFGDFLLLHKRYGIWLTPVATICELAGSVIRSKLFAVDHQLVLEMVDKIFSEDLVCHPLVPRSMNNCDLDHLHKQRAGYTLGFLVELHKVFSRFGIIPSLKFDWSPSMGLFITATETIPANTLLCEYAGVVEMFRWSLIESANPGDSLYTLLQPSESDKKLVINPEPMTNIGRFFSGVNNSLKDSQSKQNVRACRFGLENQMHIFLISTKEITPGSVIFLDYNEGNSLTPGYPTDQFE